MKLHVVVWVDVLEDSLPLALVDELLALRIKVILVDGHFASVLVPHDVDYVTADLCAEGGGAGDED